MNIVTGAKGFIGNHFACTVDKPLEVDIDNCFENVNKFNRWKDVDMIIHMGALSSTVNKDNKSRSTNIILIIASSCLEKH